MLGWPALLAMAVILVACAGPHPLPPAVPSPEAGSARPATPTAEPPTDTPEIAAASREPEAIPPTPRQEMAATDPATVGLGAAEPLLIEFFAFW